MRVKPGETAETTCRWRLARSACGLQRNCQRRRGVTFAGTLAYVASQRIALTRLAVHGSSIGNALEVPHTDVGDTVFLDKTAIHPSQR
jgi:hypothetical protein